MAAATKMASVEEEKVPSATSEVDPVGAATGGVDAPAAAVTYPLKVVYCGVCSMPVEYCEFSPDYDKCKEWLRTHSAEAYQQLIEQGVGELSVEEGGKKRQTRGGKALRKSKKKEVEKRVTIARASRGKRKFVTVVCGLSTCDIDVKKAAKLFGQRFACGSSVTGDDEIVIQGDVTYDLIEFIQEKWSEVTDDIIEDLGDQKR